MPQRRALAGELGTDDEVGELFEESRGFAPLVARAMAYKFLLTLPGNDPQRLQCLERVRSEIIECCGPGLSIDQKLDKALAIVKLGGAGSPQFEAAQIARKANQLKNVKDSRKAEKRQELLEEISDFRQRFVYVLNLSFGGDVDADRFQPPPNTDDGHVYALMEMLTSKIGGKKRKRVKNQRLPVMTEWAMTATGFSAARWRALELEPMGRNWTPQIVLQQLTVDQDKMQKARIPCKIVEYIKRTADRAREGGRTSASIVHRLDILQQLVDPQLAQTNVSDPTLQEVEEECARKAYQQRFVSLPATEKERVVLALQRRLGLQFSPDARQQLGQAIEQLYNADPDLYISIINVDQLPLPQVQDIVHAVATELGQEAALAQELTAAVQNLQQQETDFQLQQTPVTPTPQVTLTPAASPLSPPQPSSPAPPQPSPLPPSPAAPPSPSPVETITILPFQPLTPSPSQGTPQLPTISPLTPTPSAPTMTPAAVVQKLDSLGVVVDDMQRPQLEALVAARMSTDPSYRSSDPAILLSFFLTAIGSNPQLAPLKRDIHSKLASLAPVDLEIIELGPVLSPPATPTPVPSSSAGLAMDRQVNDWVNRISTVSGVPRMVQAPAEAAALQAGVRQQLLLAPPSYTSLSSTDAQAIEFGLQVSSGNPQLANIRSRLVAKQAAQQVAPVTATPPLLQNIVLAEGAPTPPATTGGFVIPDLATPSPAASPVAETPGGTPSPAGTPFTGAAASPSLIPSQIQTPSLTPSPTPTPAMSAQELRWLQEIAANHEWENKQWAAVFDVGHPFNSSITSADIIGTLEAQGMRPTDFSNARAKECMKADVLTQPGIVTCNLLQTLGYRVWEQRGNQPHANPTWLAGELLATCTDPKSQKWNQDAKMITPALKNLLEGKGSSRKVLYILEKKPDLLSPQAGKIMAFLEVELKADNTTHILSYCQRYDEPVNNKQVMIDSLLLLMLYMVLQTWGRTVAYSVRLNVNKTGAVESVAAYKIALLRRYFGFRRGRGATVERIRNAGDVYDGHNYADAFIGDVPEPKADPAYLVRSNIRELELDIIAANVYLFLSQEARTAF